MARFNKQMFEYMKEQRGLDFLTRNMTVEVDGEKGIVTGDCNGNLAVKFEGNKHSDNCHPHWRVKYFNENGELIKEYGD
jgi:hypothetical protein